MEVWKRIALVVMLVTATAMKANASWTEVSTPTLPAGVAGVVHDGSQFVLVAAGGVIKTSSNGTDWTTRTSGTTRDLEDVAFGGGRFIAGGAGGVLLTSANGNTWTVISAGADLSPSVNDIERDGTHFVLVGDSGFVGFINDGETSVNDRTIPGASRLDSAASNGNGRFAVAGLDKLWYTDDLYSETPGWNQVTGNLPTETREIAYLGGEDKYVLVANYYLLKKASLDATSTAQGLTFANSMGDWGTQTTTRSVALVCNNARCVSIQDNNGTGSIISNSANGSSWSLTAGYATGSYFSAACYDGQRFWVYGNVNSVPYVLSEDIVANNAPVAMNDNYSVTAGNTLTVGSPGILSNDSDGDGDSMTSALVADVDTGTLDFNANGSFSYTPANGYTGTVTFTYKASDGVDDSNIATVTINVKPQPTAVNDEYTVVKNGTLFVDFVDGVLANDTVATDETKYAVKVTDPSNGTVDLAADGSFEYSPDQDFVGQDTFTYYVTNGTLNSSPATVTITVVGTYAAEDDSYTYTIGSTLDVTAANGLMKNDILPDVEGNCAVVVQQPDAGKGTVVVDEDGSFTYTPGQGFGGTAVFTYRVMVEGTEPSNVATVTLRAKTSSQSSGGSGGGGCFLESLNR